MWKIHFIVDKNLSKHNTDRFVAKLCHFSYFTISFPVGSQTGSLKHVYMEVEYNSSDPEIFVTIGAEKHQNRTHVFFHFRFWNWWSVLLKRDDLYTTTKSLKSIFRWPIFMFGALLPIFADNKKLRPKTLQKISFFSSILNFEPF